MQCEATDLPCSLACSHAVVNCTLVLVCKHTLQHLDSILPTLTINTINTYTQHQHIHMTAPTIILNTIQHLNWTPPTLMLNYNTYIRCQYLHIISTVHTHTTINIFTQYRPTLKLTSTYTHRHHLHSSPPLTLNTYIKHQDPHRIPTPIHTPPTLPHNITNTITYLWRTMLRSQSSVRCCRC